MTTDWVAQYLCVTYEPNVLCYLMTIIVTIEIYYYEVSNVKNYISFVFCKYATKRYVIITIVKDMMMASTISVISRYTLWYKIVATKDIITTYINDKINFAPSIITLLIYTIRKISFFYF